MGGAEGPKELSNTMAGVLLAYVRRSLGEAAVLRVVEAAGDGRRLAEIEDPTEWSSYEQVHRLFLAAIDVTGDPAAPRAAGEELFRYYSGSEVISMLRSLGGPGTVMRLIADLATKQSTVMAYSCEVEGEDHAELIGNLRSDIRPQTIWCQYAAGVFSSIPWIFGRTGTVVEETECQTRGDDRCRFHVTWRPETERDRDAEIRFLTEQVAGLTSRFEALEELATELASGDDIDTVLTTITTRASVAVRAPQYLLAVRLPNDDRLQVHRVGIDEHEAAALAAELMTPDPDDHGGARLIVDVASSDHFFGRLAALQPDGLGFVPEERRLLMAYAGHAAAALQTAAAHGETRDRNTTLSALLSLGRSLSQVRTRQDVADRLADALLEVVACDEAHVLLWNPEDAALSRAASASRVESAPAAGAPKVLRDKRVANDMLAMPYPTYASSMSDPVAQGVLRLIGLSSAVLVPISARDEFFGLLAVTMTDGNHQPDEVARERLTGVAGLAATAIDNAMLLDEVRHQALHDPITELANSRMFEDRVVHAMSLSRRSGSHLALLFVDLDRFKAVNDEHGHKVGDKLLREVADRLLATVRGGDTVARIGGDEFGILLEDVGDIGDAEAIASKVIDGVGTPFRIGPYSLSIGASVGITLFPEPDDTYETVVSRADSAMYEAKAKGRGRYLVAAARVDHDRPA